MGKKKRVKRVPTGKFHSAKSGRYVEKEFAEENKEKVVEETKVVEAEDGQEEEETENQTS